MLSRIKSFIIFSFFIILNLSCIKNEEKPTNLNPESNFENQENLDKDKDGYCNKNTDNKSICKFDEIDCDDTSFDFNEMKLGFLDRDGDGVGGWKS